MEKNDEIWPTFFAFRYLCYDDGVSRSLYIKTDDRSLYSWYIQFRIQARNAHDVDCNGV